MDCSMPGFPVLHHLPKFAQILVHWVGDAIRLSHPLLSPSPPACNLSKHQGLFKWVGSSYQVANVLELQLQHQTFQLIFKVDFLYDWLVCSPYSPRDSQESSPTTQFESIDSLALSLLYGPTLTSVHDYWKKHSFDYMDLCWQSDVCFLIHCWGLSQLYFQGASIRPMKKSPTEKPPLESGTLQYPEEDLK